jgi:hypothetical protein
MNGKTKLTEAQRASVLAQQERDWPKHLAGAKQGNPFATLCQHCYGRHAPPRDDICPHEPPPRAGRAALNEGGER